MKDFIKEIKKNRKEIIIKDIIDNNCFDYNSVTKKFKNKGMTMYYINNYHGEFTFNISRNNIMYSGLFNDFTMYDVISVIHKYYNPQKYEIVS